MEASAYPVLAAWRDGRLQDLVEAEWRQRDQLMNAPWDLAGDVVAGQAEAELEALAEDAGNGLAAWIRDEHGTGQAIFGEIAEIVTLANFNRAQAMGWVR